MSDLAIVYEENHKWTYADYKGWDLKPGERYELFDGTACAMSAPNTEHQRINTILTGEFYAFLKGKTCQPFAAPFDVRLFYEEDESDTTVVQPDLSVVCDPAKLGKESCHGAPDLVVEILSPSNSAFEMYRKLNFYKQAGVREYWVVDPEHKAILIYYLAEDRLVELKAGETAKSGILSGLNIPLDIVFAHA